MLNKEVIIELRNLLWQVQAAAGKEFSGLGLLVCDSPEQLPIMPLRPKSNPPHRRNLIDSLVAISSPSSEYHDGFHILSTDWRLTLVSQYFSPQIVEDAVIDRSKVFGGRYLAALLSLKLNRRDAGRLAGDQISRPKPCAQRHMAAFHDGANRQARIVAALATAQDTGTSGDAEGIACGMAMRTDEAVAPSSFFHVGSTLRFIGKKLLKLWKRPRKGQVVTLNGSLSIIHTKSIPRLLQEWSYQGL